MKRLVVFLMVFSLLMGITGCLKKKDDHSNEGVCILDNASVRAEPSKKGQWLSSLTLGETVTLESATQKDATDPKLEYIKVKLSDGTEGYVNTFCLATKAYAGVVYNEAKIYKRPDLLAVTNQKLNMMELVAVEEENGSFLRVTGEGRAISGWIEKDAISKDKHDIVTAVLLKKALRGKKTVTAEEMDQIVAKLPYPDNDFVQKAREIYGLNEAPADSEPAVDDGSAQTQTDSDSTANDNASSGDSEDTGD